MADYQSRFTGLQIDAAVAKIGQMEISVEEDLKQVESDLETVKADIATANADLTKAKTDIANANADLSKAKTDISNLNTDLAAANAELAKPITSTKIADGSITTPKLVTNAVTADKIIANAIGADKIAANAVTAAKIISGAISADKIATNAVTSDKIIANAITSAKIATNAVTADKIVANAITGDKIAASTITGDKIASKTITADKINGTNLNVVNGTFSGSLQSPMGKIGGWNIGDNCLYSDIEVVGQTFIWTWKNPTSLTIENFDVEFEFISNGIQFDRLEYTFTTDGDNDYYSIKYRRAGASGTSASDYVIAYQDGEWRKGGYRTIFTKDSVGLTQIATLTGEEGGVPTGVKLTPKGVGYRYGYNGVYYYRMVNWADLILSLDPSLLYTDLDDPFKQ